MPKSKVSAFLSVLLVFASGAAMGVVGYRLYVVKSVASSVGQPPPKKKMSLSPEDFRKRIVAHLKEAVKLSDQQVEQVQKIYDWQGEQFTPIQKQYQAKIDPIMSEFDQQRDQLHLAAVAKMKAILTPEQQPLYDKWLADRAADHKKHQQEQQQQHGQGPHNDGHRPPPLP
jgi:uncharacterized membrane-anchored protein YhcB (DUF1043 family)